MNPARDCGLTGAMKGSPLDISSIARPTFAPAPDVAMPATQPPTPATMAASLTNRAVLVSPTTCPMPGTGLREKSSLIGSGSSGCCAEQHAPISRWVGETAGAETVRKRSFVSTISKDFDPCLEGPTLVRWLFLLLLLKQRNWCRGMQERTRQRRQ